MESVEICQAVLSRLRTCGITEEEGGLWVLDRLGCFFCESALAACIARLAGQNMLV